MLQMIMLLKIMQWILVVKMLGAWEEGEKMND